jgi:serine/threonine protein kinase
MSSTGKFVEAKDSSSPSFDGPFLEEKQPSVSVIGSSGMTYRRVKDLGEGGTAKAVLAYGVGSGGFSKLVVLKMLHAELAQDPAARAMFESEARLSARLNHPNLVQVYEVVDAELPFLVMEYLDGKPLSRVFAAGAMSQAMLLTVVAEALLGLHHAHELCDFDGQPLNIVHRDISPHNVFVTYDGAVKLLDFGIAKAAGGGSNTETGEVKGKLAYMAPEQLLGQKMDRRADIFSAGCILWEAVVGSRIWGEMSDGAVMHRLATGEIPRPDGHTGMGPHLEQIVAKATATAPEDRYETALELQRDLTSYIAERWGGPSALRDIGMTLAAKFKDERERNKKLLGSALADSSATVSEAGARSKSGARPAVATRGRRRWLAPAAALVLISVVAVIGEWSMRPKEQSVGAEPVPAAVASIHILVVATPPETAIEIDGRDRGTAPVSFYVAADAQDHELRAVAPGYTPEQRTLKFSRDQEITISLGKLATKAAVPAPSNDAATGHPAHAALPRNAVIPKPKATASAPEPNCSPPYYFSNGIKTFKPECL